MWRGTLFFITIVMVTASGRAAVAEYARETMSLLATGVAGSDFILLLIAFSALGSILLMCRRSPEKSAERWVWQEIRGDPGIEKKK